MSEARAFPSIEINTIYTLGLSSTNYDRAAREWFARNSLNDETYLHLTLEVAAETVHSEPGSALLGCIAYPKLHILVFTNLNRLTLVDCFVMPTYNMVLVTREDAEILDSLSTRPAPQHLVLKKAFPNRRLVNSNAQAALDCAHRLTDACITTSVAAEECGLAQRHTRLRSSLNGLHYPHSSKEPGFCESGRMITTVRSPGRLKESVL